MGPIGYGRAVCDDFPAFDVRRIAPRIPTAHGSDGVTIEHGKGRTRVDLVYTDQHLGGRRPWFRCPACGRRCLRLYRRLESLACRTCHDLAYASQHESREDRLRRRARSIRRRLGGSINLLEPFPERPKGMRRHVYADWRRKGLNAEHAILAAMQEALQRPRPGAARA